MKQILRGALLSAFTFTLFAASIGVPNNVFCAVDDTPAIWNGRTTSANGHMFYRFRCLQGHEFWVREN